MSWEAIGAIAEVVGAIAVVVSLLYLAWQIRSSRRTDQIFAASATATATDDWLRQIVSDEVLYELYERGLFNYESLSKTEKGRFSLLVLQFLRNVDNVWRQHLLGVSEDDYWMGIVETTRFIVGSPGGRRAFARGQYFLSPIFVREVRRILDEADPATDSVRSD